MEYQNQNGEGTPIKKRRNIWLNLRTRGKFSYTRKSFKGDDFAQCIICRIDFSVTHEGENYIARHNAATSDWDQNITKAELLFAGFLVEHNLPLAIADHAGNLFKATFPDLKIANKYKSGRTKTSHIANWISSKAP